MHDEVKCLLKKARAGDREARNELVKKNMGLVWNVVKRFTGRGYDAEDIFQIGCIGLIKAIDNFDMSFNVCFSTYSGSGRGRRNSPHQSGAGIHRGEYVL